MYKQMYFVFLQEKNSSVHTVLLLVDKDSSYMRVDKRTLPQVSDSLRWLTHWGDWLTQVTDSLR